MNVKVFLHMNGKTYRVKWVKYIDSAVWVSAGH